MLYNKALDNLHIKMQSNEFFSKRASFYHTIQEGRKAANSLMRAGKIGLAITAPLGVAAGAYVIKNMMDNSKSPVIDQNQINNNINEVIKLKPHLESANKEMLKRYYSSLSKVAPNVMKDTITASSVLERAHQYGGIDHNLVKELAHTEKSLQDLKSNKGQTFMDAANLGAKVLGSTLSLVR